MRPREKDRAAPDRSGAVHRDAMLTLSFLLLMASPIATAADADVSAMFERAEAAGRVGVARKTKLVDGREARPGEIIVTVIKGEGEETRSPPAEAGDVVIRNRCPKTGNEEYLVTAAKLPNRYEGPLAEANEDGWRPYRPKGIEMHFFVVGEEEGEFMFTAPWGEEMVARPGDAIVRNPDDPEDTYRVAAASFACTYDIIER